MLSYIQSVIKMTILPKAQVEAIRICILSVNCSGYCSAQLTTFLSILSNQRGNKTMTQWWPTLCTGSCHTLVFHQRSGFCAACLNEVLWLWGVNNDGYGRVLSVCLWPLFPSPKDVSIIWSCFICRIFLVSMYKCIKLQGFFFNLLNIVLLLKKGWVFTISCVFLLQE